MCIAQLYDQALFYDVLWASCESFVSSNGTINCSKNQLTIPSEMCAMPLNGKYAETTCQEQSNNNEMGNKKEKRRERDRKNGMNRPKTCIHIVNVTYAVWIALQTFVWAFRLHFIFFSLFFLFGFFCSAIDLSYHLCSLIFYVSLKRKR